MATKESQPNRRHVAIRWAIGASVVAVVLSVGSAAAYVHVRYTDTISPNVTVAGVDISGLSQEDAAAKLQSAVDAANAEPIRLSGDKIDAALSKDDLAVSYDVAKSVSTAFLLGRHENWALTIVDQLGFLLNKPAAAPLLVTFDRAAVDDAITKLNTSLGQPAVNATLVRAKNGSLSVTDEHSGIGANADSVVAAIQIDLETLTANRTVAVVVSEETPTVTKSDVEAIEPTVSSLLNAPLAISIPGQPVITVDAATLIKWVTFVRSVDGQTSSTVLAAVPATSGAAATIQAVVDQPSLNAYLDTLTKKVNQPAIDAKLTITNGRVSVFQASQPGKTLDQAAGADVITNALVNRAKAIVVADPAAAPDKTPIAVTLSIKTVEPTVSESSLNSLGINQLIGSGTTDFSGSPDNRIHNIQVGTKALAGFLIKPGDEFSTVKTLGTIDGSTGYLPELVILGNKTVPEFGGGLCQVSTTLFRAVLNAGLPVTERVNHSYRVVYYERGIGPGLDATVYDPQPDFRFKNDTPGWILVQASITGNTLKFELYGTSDGRTSTIDGPHTLTNVPAPADETQVDNSLAPGTKKQIQFAHPGATTTATYTVMRGGKQINQQVFNSKYKAMPAVYAVGPDAPASN